MGTGEKTFGDLDTLGGVAGGAAWQAAEGLTFGELETLRDEGVLLAGRYKVVRRLGEGGMGSVWLAEDSKLDGRKVAVKMLPAVLAGKKGAYRQVKAEAMVAMKLSHPNIATVRAFEEDEGGNPFLVMDYIEGEGLDDMLAEKGALSEEETRRVLGPVAAALDYAHSKGVVHRDVKPGNVMVAKDGTPYVLDFGIAREVQETLTRVTGKLSSGTLLYMSPEQLRGRAPKAAQDVYSFAAMAYECLAGHPPFFRGAIEDQIKNEPPESLPEGVGEGLRAGVMAGLAKEAEGRPGSCAEVLGEDEATKRAREERERREAEEALRKREEELLRTRERARAEEEERRRATAALEAERSARRRAQAEPWEGQRTQTARGGAAGWAWFLVIVLLVGGVVAFANWQAERKASQAEVRRLKGEAEAQRKAQAEAEAQRKAEAGDERKAERGAWDGSYRGEARDVALPNRETMRLHWCPDGSFTMGSPATEEGRDNDETQHEVTLTRGFWMAETEVTQGQWKALMNGETVADLARKALQDDTEYDLAGKKQTFRALWGLRRFADPMNRCGDLDDAVPVYNVSWGEAREFCRRLTEKGHNEGWLPAGYRFRLPTEAEWEYACRAGTKTALPNGKDIRILGEHNAPALNDIAWYGGNSSVGFKEEGLDRAIDTDSWSNKQYPGGRAFVRKVKGKAPNGWGLHDMIGNVWEWCEDEYAGYPVGAVTNYCMSNSNTALGVLRVHRGGSWSCDARGCRSANRDRDPAGRRAFLVGFRPVCSAGPVQ